MHTKQHPTSTSNRNRQHPPQKTTQPKETCAFWQRPRWLILLVFTAWTVLSVSCDCGGNTRQRELPRSEKAKENSTKEHKNETLTDASLDIAPKEGVHPGDLNRETPQETSTEALAETAPTEKPTTTENKTPDNNVTPGALLTTLTVKEPAGVARMMGTVKTGVPFPKGQLSKGAAVALFAQGSRQPLPLQTRTLSKWDDGSVRWLFLVTQLPLGAGETKTLELRSSPIPTSTNTPLKITETNTLITIQTGGLTLELPKENGGIFHSIKIGQKTLLAPPAAGETRGPWVKHSDNKMYWGSALKKTSLPVKNAPISGYRQETSGYPLPPTLRDPWNLSVTIEDKGPVYAVVRISGALLNTDGTAFCHFITRVHAFRGQEHIKLEHTLVYTGDGDRDRIKGYGLRIPYKGSRTLLDGLQASTGSIVHLSANAHTLNGTNKTGRALGVIARDNGQTGVGIVLRDMALHFPKALIATTDALDVQLYPEVAPAWNLARYSKTNSNGETGQGDNQGAQGLSKSDTLLLQFSTTPLQTATLKQMSERLNKGPLLALAPPRWYSDARVMGVGAFSFDTALNQNEVHYRIDRILHIIADFMRYNQRKQFGWFGLENYGDIRGLFHGGCRNNPPACLWSTKGRYGWSGNSGEPSNQLWVQFLRTPSRALFLDAEALARHSLDVQMVHYADGVSQGIKRGSWSGRNREFSVGSQHRHGQQAWSGYAGQPEYSHVAGIETYYYLTGSGRAKETLYEAASFVTRFGGDSVSSTRGNGLDTLSRAAAVFFDQPKLQTTLQKRIQKHLDYWDSTTALSKELDGRSSPPFEFFVRMAPGLLYHHERTNHPKLASIILNVADKIVANKTRWGGLDTKHEANGEFFHMNTLAYAANLKASDPRSRKPYLDLAKNILELNAHNQSVPGATDTIPLDSFKRIPQDWRSWTWKWKSGLLSASSPELLSIARDLTFRNDAMQDYHSYRLFIHLATLAAAIPPSTPGLKAR